MVHGPDILTAAAHTDQTNIPFKWRDETWAEHEREPPEPHKKSPKENP